MSIEKYVKQKIGEQHIVYVEYELPVISGKRYKTISDALTYIATQSPAIDNRWCLQLGAGTYAENITVPDWVLVKGAGSSATILTGQVTSANYFPFPATGEGVYKNVIQDCQINDLRFETNVSLAVMNCIIKGGSDTAGASFGVFICFDSNITGGTFDNLQQFQIYRGFVLGGTITPTTFLYIQGASIIPYDDILLGGAICDIDNVDIWYNYNPGDGVNYVTFQNSSQITNLRNSAYMVNSVIGTTAPTFNTASRTYNFYNSVLGDATYTAGTFNHYGTAESDKNKFEKIELVNPVDEFSTDGTLAGNSDTALPTEKAVKTYVDNSGGSSNIDDGTASGQMTFWDGTVWTYTETSELFWDDTNKRVGIGTDSPGYKLDVRDDTRISGDVYILSDGTNAYPKLKIFSDRTSPTSSERMEFYQQGNISRFISRGAGGMKLDVDYSGYGTALSINTAGKINIYGDVAMGGNVGIGTDSPSAPLHLVDSGTTSFTPWGGAQFVFEQQNSQFGGLNLLAPSNKGVDIIFGHETDALVGGIQYDFSNDKMNFQAGDWGTKIATLDGNNENVGIGTDSPSSFAKLHVDKSSNSRIILSANNNASWITQRATGSSTPNYIMFGENDLEINPSTNLVYVGDTLLHLSMSGKVGIGTSSPNSTLHNAGSFSLPYVEKTANYTLTASDYTVNCTANTFTITLPTSVGIAGRIYNIKNSGTGIITVDGNGAETIDGELTQTLYETDSICIQSTGSNWIII